MGDFDKLRELLEKEKHWPVKYMFKFIVPNNEGRVQTVIDMMPKEGKLSFAHTKNLMFVSVTCVAWMESAQKIIEITQNALSVDGVVML